MDSIVENVLAQRYYQDGESSWGDIVSRVVNHIYPTNCKDKELFRELLSSRRFIPNSPTLMNSGNEIGQLSACFCLSINDDMTSIFDTLKRAALIFKSGGGVGINFSYLRPKGAKIGSTNGTSTGVLGFIEVFNTMVETVKSAGMRRGAAIAILDISHPDIEEFIEYKNTEGKLSNFNISVMISDDFMDAVNHNRTWNLTFNDKVYKTVRARDLYDKIAQSMWTRAEPGILFYDAINRDNILESVYGPIDSCNPCGEKMLVTDHETGGGSSCNLGSLNLSMYVSQGSFKADKFAQDVRSAVRILDRIIDVNKFPIPEIEKISKDVRELGIGVMGYHDMLIQLGLIYGSDKALKFTEDLFKLMKDTAISESQSLALQYGPFPAYKRLPCNTNLSVRRNAFLLSIAPTGTISMISGCSSGIEPNFSYVYNRTTMVDGTNQTYKVVSKVFEDCLNAFPDYKESIVDYMYEHGSIQSMNTPKGFPKNLFKTAKDIDWEDHLKTQGLIQRYIDSSISKTINCPNDTTVTEIRDMIAMAHEYGCKGFTIYREGSRSEVVLETGSTNSAVQPKVIELTNPIMYKLVTAKEGRILPRTPRVMPATQYKVTTGCGHMLVSIGEVNGRPHSITIINKGGCDASTQAIAELIALIFRTEWPLWDLTKILCGVTCPAAMKNPKSDGRSCAAIIGKIIKDNYPCEDEPPKIDNITVVNEKLNETVTINPNKCPECGNKLDHAEGCVKCASCGYSKCG